MTECWFNEAMSGVSETSNEPQRDVAAAAEFMQEAERQHRIRTWVIGEQWAAVLALRATSLAEYVCSFNIALADRERQRAATKALESDRRRPSGRRVHTLAESQDLRDDGARHLAAADSAELEALSVIGTSDLATARLAVAHMNLGEAVAESGSTSEEWYTALDLTTRFRAWQQKRRRWTYVRGRAQQASQPHGGLLPLPEFEKYELGGAPLTRSTESGNPGTIASAVELIARWDLAEDPRVVAEPSAAALEAIRGVRRGEHTTAGPGLLAAIQRKWEWNDDALDELDWEEEEAMRPWPTSPKCESAFRVGLSDSADRSMRIPGQSIHHAFIWTATSTSSAPTRSGI